MNGIIQFSDVVFRYPARHKVQVHLCQSIDQSKIYRDLSLQVLSGLDFTIQEGQVVALVGPSGCGKSTVVQLVQRFYDVSGGKVATDVLYIA